MRLLNHLIPGRTDMPDKPDDIARLRKSHYALEDLPETIAFPQHPGHETKQAMPVVDATIDDVAFAIVAAELESSAAYRRSSALQRLYKIAREAGAVGADCTVAAALKREVR